MKKQYVKPSTNITDIKLNSQLCCNSGNCDRNPYNCGTTCNCGCNDNMRDYDNNTYSDSEYIIKTNTIWDNI